VKKLCGATGYDNSLGGIVEATTPRNISGRRLRRALYLQIAVLAAVSVPGSEASSEAAIHVTNGPIAFVSELHASEVYIARADGTAPQRLTNDLVGSRWPALSPDGTQIAFARRHGSGWAIVVSRLDGSGARDIVSEAGFTSGFSGYPDWSPDGKQIAFTHEYPDGHAAIVDFDLASGTAHDITHDTAADLWPRWSPDGTRIAYATNVPGQGIDIYTIGADGTNPTRLTTGAGWEIEPSWSPDGTRIAYTAFPNGVGDIFVMNADGTGVRDVTNTPQSDDEEPFWAATGLVFRGNGLAVPQLFFVRADGTGLKELTSGEAENSDPYVSHDGSRLLFVSDRNARTEVAVSSPAYRLLTSGPLDSDPAWSPDGKEIAFARNRSIRSQDIYVADADGRHDRNLTHGRGINWAPAWSPDGKHIAFVRFESFGAQIWEMNTDGTNKRALTSVGDWNDHPSWSPDGRSIVYSAQRNGNYDLYVLDLRTGTERRLTRDARAEVQPAWSPDGALVAFVAYVPGTEYTEIYLVSPRGGPVRALTHTTSNSNSAPAWSPDGKWIAFESEVFLGHDTDLYVISRSGGAASRYTSFEWNERTPAWRPLP